MKNLTKACRELFGDSELRRLLSESGLEGSDRERLVQLIYEDGFGGDIGPMERLLISSLVRAEKFKDSVKSLLESRADIISCSEAKLADMQKRIDRLESERKMLRSVDRGEFVFRKFVVNNSSEYVKNGTSVLYFLCKDGDIVYVGKTKNLMGRLARHSEDKDFDSYFHVNVAEDELDGAEVHYIKLLKPKLNVAHLK